jgi:hypothetical protein
MPRVRPQIFPSVTGDTNPANNTVTSAGTIVVTRTDALRSSPLDPFMAMLFVGAS